jgi:hypothetical protein
VSAPAWTAVRFFELLRSLGPLRVISQCGPSTFEAICTLGAFGVRDGYLNAITDAYHWHVALGAFGHLRSRDAVHARSGRRVLYFELRESPDARPFLLIYLYRAKDAELDDERAARFAAAHAELEAGARLESAEAGATP